MISDMLIVVCHFVVDGIMGRTKTSPCAFTIKTQIRKFRFWISSSLQKYRDDNVFAKCFQTQNSAITRYIVQTGVCLSEQFIKDKQSNWKSQIRKFVEYRNYPIASRGLYTFYIFSLTPSNQMNARIYDHTRAHICINIRIVCIPFNHIWGHERDDIYTEGALNAWTAAAIRSGPRSNLSLGCRFRPNRTKGLGAKQGEISRPIRQQPLLWPHQSQPRDVDSFIICPLANSVRIFNSFYPAK